MFSSGFCFCVLFVKEKRLFHNAADPAVDRRVRIVGGLPDTHDKEQDDNGDEQQEQPIFDKDLTVAAVQPFACAKWETKMSFHGFFPLLSVLTLDCE